MSVPFVALMELVEEGDIDQPVTKMLGNGGYVMCGKGEEDGAMNYSEER